MTVHWYKRNIGDYAKKTGRLTMLQHGSYTLLLDACYDREQFPTLEQAIEWVWASTPEEIEAVKFVLSRFFINEENGTFTQSRVLDELLDYHSKADKNKQIAIDRETKRRENSTNRARSVNEAPPNQEPRTKNHKPIVRESTHNFLDILKTMRPELDGELVLTKFKEHYPENKQTLTNWKGWIAREQAPEGPNDPNSRASIEAKGLALGFGKWDEMQERFHGYKQRVLGAS
jgi:uncharacterized protein YdaU (DUF1376 family)